MRDGLEQFVEALTAPSMLAAQSHERTGQEQLDAGTESLELLDEIGESETLTALPAPAHYGAIGRMARTRVGATGDLEALDRQLQTLYGHAPGTSVGLGLQIHALRHLVITALDIEECETVARASEDLLAASPSARAVCQSEAWQNEHGRAAALLSASAFAMSSVGTDVSDLEVVKHCMELVVTCRDAAIRHALATITASSENEYTRLVRSSAGALIKRAAREHPQLHLDKNLYPSIRNAAAHAAYDVDGRGVILHADGGEEVHTFEDFLDRVLAYLEEGVALTLGLVTALAKAGVPIRVTPHLSLRDRKAALFVLLGTLGVEVDELSIESSTITLKGAGFADDFMTIVAGIAAVAPDHAEFVVATSDQGGTNTEHCEANVEPYRAYSSGNPSTSQESALALARVVAVTRVRGTSPWSDDQWAGAAIHVLESTTDDTLRARVRRLREFRDLARTAASDAVVERCTTLLEGLRRGDGTTRTTPPEAFRRT